ncbi:MAG: 23S rRNA (pseudouridine(1915)-N(3))-methyltransferase RlmH [Saprospiraceae bacterium]|jgi:23S rRNA (pseudouridine1915-N3)-methyltransferase|nr:23S rRNA (pseudouridine(1915)-N(3))-methyltransferase RlmH [Saprospiraceae bacterium]
MKISIWSIGKTSEKYLIEGIDIYIKRLSHYTKIHYEEWKDVKPSQDATETTKREAEMILSKVKTDDFLVLLDERGKPLTSKEYAAFLEKCQNQSIKHLILHIGGAFGHHELLKQRANALISLSPMTFTHQMARMILAEQTYRAFTILQNEKYHNE